MSSAIPVTPLFRYYAELQFKGAGRRGESAYKLRLKQARTLLAEPDRLVEMFEDSVAAAEEYYAHHVQSDLDFYPPRTEHEQPAGVASTAQLGKWLGSPRRSPWQVLGDDSLSFYFLDREIVPTRAPRTSFSDGRNSKDGPRLDLLLANAHTGRPIVGEVKLTSKRGSPDKDTFFALVQALAAAAYLLPANQMTRLRRPTHDPKKRLKPERKRLDLYLLTGEVPPYSPIWFDLRDCAEQLATALAPRLSHRINMIASVELAWFKDRPGFKDRPESTRLRITKRFSHRSENESAA
jgi:hypothetical protein